MLSIMTKAIITLNSTDKEFHPSKCHSSKTLPKLYSAEDSKANNKKDLKFQSSGKDTALIQKSGADNVRRKNRKSKRMNKKRCQRRKRNSRSFPKSRRNLK